MYQALFLHFIKVYRAMDGVSQAKIKAFTLKEKAKTRCGIPSFEGELSLKKEVERAQDKIADAWRFLSCLEGDEDLALSFMKDFLTERASLLAEIRLDLFAGKYR